MRLSRERATETITKNWQIEERGDLKKKRGTEKVTKNWQIEEGEKKIGLRDRKGEVEIIIKNK